MLEKVPTRGNERKLYKERCRSQMRQKQFRVRVVDPWNSLPDQVISAPSMKSFERRLDRFWASQEIRFDYDKLIRTTSSARIKATVYESDSDLDIEVS